MSEVIQIEIGKTDGFHYLGVQPPSAMNDVEVDELELPFAAHITSRNIINPGNDNAYYDLGYDSSALPPELADEAAVETAHRLAMLVTESGGKSVTIKSEVKWIGYGKYLFGIDKSSS